MRLWLARWPFFISTLKRGARKKHDTLLAISRNRIVKSIKNPTTFQTLWSPEEDTSSERSFSKPACKWDHLFLCLYFWHLMQIVHIFLKRMLFKGNVNPNIWIFLLFKGGGMYPRNLKIILLTKTQFSGEWEDTFLSKIVKTNCPWMFCNGIDFSLLIKSPSFLSICFQETTARQEIGQKILVRKSRSKMSVMSCCRKGGQVWARGAGVFKINIQHQSVN